MHRVQVQKKFGEDETQTKLFLIESTDQLYGCLDEFYTKVKNDRG